MSTSGGNTVLVLNSSERRFGIFLIVSVIVHAGLFLAYPRLLEQLSVGSAWGHEQGVVQVIRVENVQKNQGQQAPAKVAPEPKPQPKPEPKPQPKPKPKPEPKPQPKPQPKPEPKPEPEPKPQPKPEPKPKVEAPKSEAKPESSSVSAIQAKEPVKAEPRPVVNEPNELPSAETGEQASSQVLTSEQGEETVMAEKAQPAAPQVSETSAPPVDESSAPEPKPEPEVVSEAEPEPEPAPAPPPLPAASSIMPRASLAYPKGAQNEGAAGVWIGRVLFPKDGKPPVVLAVDSATGNRSLDAYAELVLEKGLRYPTGSVDYVAQVTVSFTGAPEYGVHIGIDNIEYAE